MSVLGLFDRAVAVEIGPEGGSGVRLADLRVSFRCEHHADKTPNKAKIRIWNPSPASVALTRVPLALVRVFAGYGGQPRQIFQGNPTKGGVNLRTEGADRILEIDAVDGGRAYEQTTIAVGWTTSTTYGQALATILASTGWGRGFIGINEGQTLGRGITYIGKPDGLVTRLAETVTPPGADWYVRDGALFITTRGQAAPGTAPLISSATGNLIGTSSNVDAKTVRCTALLDASFRAGSPYVLESLNHQGVYVARDVVFTGDSGWGRPFYAELTGRPQGVP